MAPQAVDDPWNVWKLTQGILGMGPLPDNWMQMQNAGFQGISPEQMAALSGAQMNAVRAREAIGGLPNNSTPTSSYY